MEHLPGRKRNSVNPHKERMPRKRMKLVSDSTPDGGKRRHKRLLTVPQAAERMTISHKSTWRMVYARKLEVVRIGHSVRVTEESVDHIIEDGTTPPICTDDDDQSDDGGE